MRFFSNDARESTDEQATDERADRPERVQSDPVAVPSQRPPSPWSDKPATDDPAATDTDRRDETQAADPNVEAERAEGDPPPFHEPSPQPTAFGASTVGGAVAASATANPADDRRDVTERDAAADSGVRDDASVTPGDGVVTSSTNTYAGSNAGTAPDTVPATWTEHDKRDGHDHEDHDAVVDLPLDESPASSTVDDDDRPGPDTATEAGPKVDAGTDTDAGPLKDDGGFDDPKAVDPVTDTPLDAAPTSGDSSTDASPAAAVAVAAVPAAASAAAPAETLFGAADAQAFQERWRDVQLRFVDSPKDAATEAAGLVDEAVEKLTASLRSQRDGLTDDTEDTEKLRVQLRGYRDILNRILSL